MFKSYQVNGLLLIRLSFLILTFKAQPSLSRSFACQNSLWNLVWIKGNLKTHFFNYQLEQPSTIEQWGESFEHVVEHALAQRNPPQQLPHSYRGRCKQPKLVKSPMMSPVRKASNGDFNPSCEVVTMASRRKVKQLRRLQSLCQRI